MPRVPYLPPASRFFARLDKFACECPACGGLITSNYDTRDTPLRLSTMGQRRGAIKQRPGDQSIQHLVWNPHTQRLRCPHCYKVCTLGLLAYDHAPSAGQYQPLNVQPADTVPDRRQRLELRQAGGGWWAEQAYAPGDEVNLVVTNPCSCPRKGWAASCPVHGDPAQMPAETDPLLKGVEK
jgi:hypothetical protein